MSLDHALDEVGLLDADAFASLAQVELKWARRFYRPLSMSVTADEPDDVRGLLERTLPGLTGHIVACGQWTGTQVVALLADLDHATVAHVLRCSSARAGAAEWDGDALVSQLIERAAGQR